MTGGQAYDRPVAAHLLYRERKPERMHTMIIPHHSLPPCLTRCRAVNWLMAYHSER
jgi:hypothetical protein